MAPFQQRREIRSFMVPTSSERADDAIVIEGGDEDSDVDEPIDLPDNEQDVFDLTDLVSDDDVEVISLADMDSDTTTNPIGSRSRKHVRVKTRNPLPEVPWAEVKEIPWGGVRLHNGKSVELTPSNDGITKPHFLAIRQILKNLETAEIKLVGLPVFRNCMSVGMFPQKLNEVYVELDEDLDDHRHIYEQGAFRVDIEDVVCVRRIIFTHRDFPDLSYRSHTFLSKSSMTHAQYDGQRKVIKTECELVCRYIKINKHKSAQARKQRRNYAETIVRRLYNGENLSKESSPMLKKNEPSRSFNIGSHGRARRPMKREKNSYISWFAGLGGDSLGAKEANFMNTGAVDHDSKCKATFELNFPRTPYFVSSATDMIMMDDGAIPHGTVGHLSCPCKPWSPAHTREGRNDDANQDALFVVEHCLRKTRPVISTAEQTSGLIRQRKHKEYFATLINQYISAGYNVRWGVFNFSDFGLGSSRERLIIFASTVGHPIPEFPRETHGTGLQPRVTKQEVMDSIPTGLDWHLDTVKPYDEPRSPDPPGFIQTCVTCKEAIQHPSGLRPITMRERAALNGFPSSFKFPALGEVIGPGLKINEGDLMTQIGNAVPPLVWEKFMKKVGTCLTDFREGRIDEAGFPVASREIVDNVGRAADRMRGMSLEPMRGRPTPTPKRSSRERSVTLSPDPPSMEHAINASLRLRTARTITNDSPSPGLRKKREFIDLCDECASPDAVRNKKKAKDCHTIDLTSDD